MTRRRLDFLLLEKATQAGAIIRERTAIRQIERRPLGDAESITVRTDGELFQGRTLVAADGANGTTARLSGVSRTMDGNGD